MIKSLLLISFGNQDMGEVFSNTSEESGLGACFKKRGNSKNILKKEEKY